MTAPRDKKPRPAKSEPPAENSMRLHKLLASAGHGSRRSCEDLVLAGRVTVDGERITELGYRADPGRQVVCLDGDRVQMQAKKYYLLNKPTGVVCTNNDPAGRPRAVDLAPQDGTRLFTVGRLDENSQGLLIVTNDGETANRLAHPRYQIPRRYRLQVAGRPNRDALKLLREGLHFADGKFRVQAIKTVRNIGSSTILEVTLTEGRNREIRRLFARIGHKVMKLTRIAFGPLHLGKLARGRCRPLRSAELAELRELIDGTPRKRRRQPARRGKPGGKAPANRGTAKRRPNKTR